MQGGMSIGAVFRQIARPLKLHTLQGSLIAAILLRR
jgi:hypothetical protein